MQLTEIVATRSGPVQGMVTNGINAFKGIPYGAPTGGKARFLPPLPRAEWSMVRPATHPGDRCPQNRFPELLAGPDDVTSTSEDCLVLNVWTPGPDVEARRPVMVWFHGGGFVIGHGGQARFDGTNLAAAEDVVVVTINHRLGVLGYLYLDELDPNFRGAGAVGQLDCIAALEWVRDNILAFGGDPANVTVFGQSGGGAKISVLMAMPAAQGLFHRAIVQSGSWLKGYGRERATANALGIMRELGLERDETAALQAVPVSRLLAAANAVIGAGLTAFGPIVDGAFLPRHPWTPDAPDLFADIPMLIGVNTHENTLFTLLYSGEDATEFSLKEEELVPRLSATMKIAPDEAAQLAAAYRDDRPQASASDIFFRATSDRTFRMPAIVQAERRYAQRAGQTYMYLFAWQSPALGGKLKASHSAEIPLIFNNEALGDATGSDEGRARFARLMGRTWAHFARTGNPGHDGLPGWSAYNPVTRPTMILDTVSRLGLDPDARARALLQSSTRV